MGVWWPGHTLTSTGPECCSQKASRLPSHPTAPQGGLQTVFTADGNRHACAAAAWASDRESPEQVRAESAMPVGSAYCSLRSRHWSWRPAVDRNDVQLPPLVVGLSGFLTARKR